MLCVEELLKLELFQTLPSDRLEWLCDRATEIKLNKGEIFLKEGDTRKDFLVMLDGTMGLTKLSQGIQMPMGKHYAPCFFGEIQILTEELVPVTLHALTDCHIYEIAAEDFLFLLYEYRDFSRIVFLTMQERIRGVESFIKNREKTSALGTLAAGLAHELNNPVAAVVRSFQNLPAAILELQRMNLVAGERNIDKEHQEQWDQVRDDGFNFIANNSSEPLAMMDRENTILEWLENYGVENAWQLSEPLAAGNVDTKLLDELLECWRDDPTEMRDMGLRWLALSFEVTMMIRSGLRGAERVSELVKSIGSYSYLDRGAKQLVDVHQGLEDTLQLLSYRLKQGIKVHRIYDRSLPQIQAYGSELNQVWTSLIDNAIDAMAGAGDLTILTENRGDRLVVKIIDTGVGIPVEIQSRIFEPFFTTKSVVNSGLGLDVVRRIIENRHDGTVTLESTPGNTCFIVCLPADSNC